MFLRFVIAAIDPESGRRRGLLQAAYDLEEAEEASDDDRDRLNRLLGWLGANMRRPTRFSVSSRPHAKAQAISWFKASATEHVAKAHELAGILRENGIAVDVLRTRRPGYVVFEDEVQVAAYPFADTPT